MARGATAKIEVIKKIAQAFGDSYIGEFDKKLYVWANDGGEKVQISIALACPKNYVGESGIKPLDSAFPEEPIGLNFEQPTRSHSEISQEEQDNIARLMKELNL